MAGAWPRVVKDEVADQSVERRLGRLAQSAPAQVDVNDDLPAWTHYAQWKIQRSQELPLDPRTGVPMTCRQTRIFLTRLIDYGLGAAIRIAAVALGHAMLMNRRVVFHPKWRRWAGDIRKSNSTCAALGWYCYFLPPSPCDVYNSDALARGAYVSPKQSAFVRRPPTSHARVLMIVAGYRYRDLRLSHFPDLLPPGVSHSRLEAAAGMKYDEWASRQLIRYLMRGLQPWAELMVLQELRRAGYPWEDVSDGNAAGGTAPPPLPVARPVIATHYRNGDVLYNNEVKPVLQCAQLDTALTVALLEETVWRLHTLETSSLATTVASNGANATNASLRTCVLRHFFSFDHYAAVQHAQAWFADSADRAEAGGPDASVQGDTDFISVPACRLGGGLRADVPVLNTTTSFRRKGEDARALMTALFGDGYVMRVSLGNLFLATSADAWVNNDASNWAMMINALRFTGAQGRHRALYTDLTKLSTKPERFFLMQAYCNIVGFIPWNQSIFANDVAAFAATHGLVPL
jgi:hypothetical protein